MVAADHKLIPRVADTGKIQQDGTRLTDHGISCHPRKLWGFTASLLSSFEFTWKWVAWVFKNQTKGWEILEILTF